MRNLVRDGLRYCGSPAKLDQLTASLINPDSPFARALRAEWANAREQPDYYLAHEYLVPNCDPLYFHEFVRHAERHQLQFAAETPFSSNAFAQPESIQAKLENAGSDPIQREQYLDWLVGRYFRRTLLCHANLPLTLDPDPQSITLLNIALTADILERTPGTIRLRQAQGKELEVTDEMYLDVIQQLEQAGAIPAHKIELAGMPSAFVAAVLWSGWRDGLWAIRAGIPAMTATISERPIACPLARLQAAAGPDCTNRHHRPVRLTPGEQQLIQTLDGTVAPANHTSLPRLAALALLAS